MKTLYFTLGSILLLVLASQQSNAQQDSVKVIPSLNLEGPRIGFTAITPGRLSNKLRSDFGIAPYMTQFGWQFENRYFTLPNGTAGLVETVILIGGMEQGVLLPSGSVLVGIRNAKGVEFGCGPNISMSGLGFAIAGGVTFTSGGINFPVNFAVVPASDGVRLSIVTGFNARKPK